MITDSTMIVSRHPDTGEQAVETIPGPESLCERIDIGSLRPGGSRVVYREWDSNRKRLEARAEWLRTEQGREVLQKALDADARGECACQELLAGPPKPAEGAR